MYEYISGKVIEKSPVHIVIENNGLGYFINISLNTFTAVGDNKEATLFIHEHIREDVFSLFGFFDNGEREVFRQLISVSGIGANTARMMLSSLPPDEVISAIRTENIPVLTSIKGIGNKTAQRIIIDLKDKVGKLEGDEKLFALKDNTNREEALSALVMLGFNKNASQKAIDKILSKEPNSKVEQIVKMALKIL